VTCSGQELAVPHYRVRAGEAIDVVDFKAPSSALREPSPLREKATLGPLPLGRGEGEGSPTILFEDDSILVLNKPAGLVVHPAPSHKGLTLVDWLENYLGPKVTGLFADASRLGVVHRLDKNTTGVLLVAKTVVAQNKISKQFQDRKVHKTYAAFIEGIPKAKTGIISAPVGRSHNVPSRMAVSSSGRPSETAFEVIEIFRKPAVAKAMAGAPKQSGAEVSQVHLYPKTGRTHQIRVHCAAIGHPIVGDSAYGANPKWSVEHGINRPLLHAERLEFEHPLTHKKIHFEAPWPQDMKKALTLFRHSMKGVLLAASIFITALSVYADESESAGAAAGKPNTTRVSTSGRASGSQVSSSVKKLKSEMASLHDQFKSLIEEVSALQDRVSGIQSSLDELNAPSRLHDLEKAISDLNGKAVANSNVSEETKSQVLDLSNKVKTQQNVLDQLRDQVDRLQRDLIAVKAHSEEAAPAPPATEATK